MYPLRLLIIHYSYSISYQIINGHIKRVTHIVKCLNCLRYTLPLCSRSCIQYLRQLTKRSLQNPSMMEFAFQAMTAARDKSLQIKKQHCVQMRCAADKLVGVTYKPFGICAPHKTHKMPQCVTPTGFLP